jgi:hypothetical protein
MPSNQLTIQDLELRFEAVRETLVVFRTSSGRVGVQPAMLKQGPDGKLKPKQLPPGAKHLARVHGHCRSQVLRAAKAKFAA